MDRSVDHLDSPVLVEMISYVNQRRSASAFHNILDFFIRKTKSLSYSLEGGNVSPSQMSMKWKTIKLLRRPAQWAWYEE